LDAGQTGRLFFAARQVPTQHQLQQLEQSVRSSKQTAGSARSYNCEFPDLSAYSYWVFRYFPRCFQQTSKYYLLDVMLTECKKKYPMSVCDVANVFANNVKKTANENCKKATETFLIQRAARLYTSLVILLCV
jgi:hypothetical protein